MNLQEKYARVILESCLKVEKDQPLFISYNTERDDFVRIVSKVTLTSNSKTYSFNVVNTKRYRIELNVK